VFLFYTTSEVYTKLGIDPSGSFIYAVRSKAK
jgi:hypothetical protein